MEEGASAEKRVGSTLFWRLFALINLVTVGWIGWVIWQLTPHPVVHEFVMRLPVSQRRAIGTIPAGAPAGVAGAAAAATVTPVAPPAPPAEIPLQSGPPMSPLKMETEIKTPTKPAVPVTPVK